MFAFSPRERGWSAEPDLLGGESAVLPARAGVVRVTTRQPPGYVGSPRASGGGPSGRSSRGRCRGFSPRERGWSDLGAVSQVGQPVLPARAGVVLPDRHPGDRGLRSPRASGGGPPRPSPHPARARFSPRERGWSDDCRRRPLAYDVLPARAGVVRNATPIASQYRGSPRASGGGPPVSLPVGRIRRFSPRERGWSDALSLGCSTALVLPARAGVVRSGTARRTGGGCSPRASGGGPTARTTVTVSTAFSPRERGWSGRLAHGHTERVVLPARAGVVRRPHSLSRRTVGSPRASGGGPPSSAAGAENLVFSPREREWSGVGARRSQAYQVLPARAGVGPFGWPGCGAGPVVPSAGGIRWGER